MRRGLALLCLLGSACAEETQTPEAPTSTPKRRASGTLLVTGDVGGEAQPLKRSQLGGISARIKEQQQTPGPKLLVDAGDHFFRTADHLPWRSDEAMAQAQLLAEGLKKGGAKVMAVGERDLAFGPEVLKELAQQAGLTLLSTNLQVAGSTAAPFAQLHTESVGGLQLGFVAASPIDARARRSNTVHRLEAVDPVPSLRAAAKKLRQQGVDAVIALLHLGQKDAAEVVASLGPAIDFAVIAHDRSVRPDPSVSGGAPMATLGERGEHLLSVKLTQSPGQGLRQTSRLIPLPALKPETKPAARPAADRSVGSKACKSCHPEAYRWWRRSPHARALATLHTKKQSRNSDCVFCHASVKGAGQRRLPAKGRIEAVACERCHGPAAKHAKNPDDERLGAVKAFRCFGCHRPQADQKPFSFAERRPLVLSPGHGRAKRSPEPTRR